MKSLFSIEQNGEREHLLNCGATLFELLETALGQAPFANLWFLGKMIDVGEFAEIEQSSNFSYSIEFNFDNGLVFFNIVYGGIPEEARTHKDFDYIRLRLADLAHVMPYMSALNDKSDATICSYLVSLNNALRSNAGYTVPLDPFVYYSEADARLTAELMRKYGSGLTNIFK